MICVECQNDDGAGASPLDGASFQEILMLCREWRCDKCLRSDEDVQADFDAEAAKDQHQSAHDWAAISQAGDAKEGA